MTGDDEPLTSRATRSRSFQPSVSARALSGLVAGLQSAGVDEAAFLREFGAESALSPDSEERYPVGSLLELWSRAAAVTGDPLFGVSAARAVEAHSFGLLSFLATTSETWGQALERVCRYFRLLTDFGRYELSVTGDAALLRFVPSLSGPAAGPVLCDFLLAVPHQYGVSNVEGFVLREVLLPYPAVPYQARLASFFEAPLRFATQSLALVFAADLLQRPLRRAEPRLGELLETLAREKVTRLPDSDQARAQLRSALHLGLRSGQASLPQVAARLGVSPRVLQRRLRAQGTSFATELDEVRRELSLSLVTQPALGLGEVAFLLGFSEVAAFHRAFRRWTGEAPGRYRQRHAERARS
jgi:AraC-like DNA-binding protein